jgi:hypothetical protein
MMNLTLGQKIAMALVALNAIAGATALLTPITGANIAAAIAGFSSLAATIVSGWMFIVTGQSNLVSQVAAMPGVTRIAVNEQASPALATVATDPNQPKVGATTPDVRQTLQTIAKGA